MMFGLANRRQCGKNHDGHAGIGECRLSSCSSSDIMRTTIRTGRICSASPLPGRRARDQVNDVCGARPLERVDGVGIYRGGDLFRRGERFGRLYSGGRRLCRISRCRNNRINESGLAYLVVSGFASSGVQIKVDNTAAVKHTITANAENAAVVFDEIERSPPRGGGGNHFLHGHGERRLPHHFGDGGRTSAYGGWRTENIPLRCRRRTSP